MKIKHGFTLAEVVITLGILGILATIALPMLNDSRPNQEMIMLKKVYYLTSRIVSELINDEDFYPDADKEEDSGFSHVTLMPAAPEAKYHGREYSGDTKFCGLFAARMNLRDAAPNCTAQSVNSVFPAGSSPRGGTFTTADNVVWLLPITNFPNSAGDDGHVADSTGQASLYVDVNGEKPGNCFPNQVVGNGVCSKPDRFEIKVDRWGKLYIDDDVTRKYLSSSNTTKSYAVIKREIDNGNKS